MLSDLSGITGMHILRAIVAGERNGQRLAEFRNPRVKASEEMIAKSLAGTWLPEQLALLQRQLADWDHIQTQIAACDRDLECLLGKLPTADKPVPPPCPIASSGKPKRKRKKGGRSSKNEPRFDLAAELTRVAGVDLRRIDGVKANTIQTVISGGRPGYEQVEHREPFCFLDRISTAQRCQWGQGAEAQNT